MTASDDVLVRVAELSVEFPTSEGTVRGLDGVSFAIASGEIVGLVGASGSGKSSAALALMGLVRTPGRISGGSVYFGGRDLLTLAEEEIRQVRGKELSLIVQNPRSALNPMLSVGEQLVNVVRAHEPLGEREAGSRALEMLGLVGINDPKRRMRAYPHELSGGMAQRVLIAMALSCRPRLLIADEPTSGLDVTIQAQILDDLLRTVQTTRSAALIVTQDLGVVANYCDRVLVLHDGRLAESADVQTFFSAAAHPASRALLSAQAASRRDPLMEVS
jgi:ABC-type dipeptide/oligopeptide/nickel transport system ATPase component